MAGFINRADEQSVIFSVLDPYSAFINRIEVKDGIWTKADDYSAFVNRLDGFAQVIYSRLDTSELIWDNDASSFQTPPPPPALQKKRRYWFSVFHPNIDKNY